LGIPHWRSGFGADVAWLFDRLVHETKALSAAQIAEGLPD
jgi:hypothetical protein